MLMKPDDFVLLFCNGEPLSRPRLESIIPHPKKIVCADGGAQKALSVGYKPDLIIGDLDSVDLTDPRISDVEIVKAASQENTDFEKTLRFTLEHGWKHILVTSFSGGRIDHTLGNIQIAYEYSRQTINAHHPEEEAEIVLIDSQFMIFPVIRNLVLQTSPGTGISILPMEDLTILSTRGLEYELAGRKLPRGGHGISNRATQSEIEITIECGGVMLFVKDV